MGAAAEMAASRKLGKCVMLLLGNFLVLLKVLETLSPINESAVEFLNNLGQRMALSFTDDNEGQFWFQRRYNAILLHESFVSDVDSDL